MKTAISVEDELLRQADKVARSLKMSRSKLFSVAMRDYLKQRRNEEIREQLDRVYGNDPDPEERRMAPLYSALFLETLKDKW